MLIKYNNIWAYVYGSNEEISIIIDCLSYNKKGSRYYTKLYGYDISGIKEAFVNKDIDKLLVLTKGNITKEELLDFVESKNVNQLIAKGAKEWQKEATMYNSKWNRFPTGLLDYVLDKTKDELEIEIEDVRPTLRDIPLQEINLYDEKIKSQFVLRDYQIEAVEKIIEKEIGIIKVPARGGKTQIAIAATQKLNRNTLFLCDTTDLLYQTHKQYENKLQTKIGIIGDSNCDIRNITIALRQSVIRLLTDKNFIRYLGDIEVYFIDEVHDASKTYRKITNLMKNARWRIGLSATPLMSGKQNKFATLTLTGPIIYEIKAKKLVDDKQLAKGSVYFVEHFIDPIDGEWPDIYGQGIVCNNERNFKVAYIALKKLKQGKSSLILIEETDHGYEIESLLKDRCRVQFLFGEHTSKQRKETLQAFQSGTLDVLIASRIFNKGIDIPFLEIVIIASGWKSAVLAIQRGSRPMTKTFIKDNATIFDFTDEQWYINDENEHVRGILYNHSLQRMKAYKKDKAFDVKTIKLEEI